MLGTLVAGRLAGWPTRRTPTPYERGHPDRDLAGGQGRLRARACSGTCCSCLVQLATALILYTGANTPFTGFPFLASFVAEDSFLPRQLTRRGHRLAFSNGIIVLTVLSLALLLGHRRPRRQRWSRSTRSACSPASPWPASGWPSTTATAPDGRAGGSKLAINALGRRRLGAGRADLRGHQVHRGRLAGRGDLPARRRRADPAQRRVPARGGGAGRAAPRLRAADAGRGTPCWSSSTRSTWRVAGPALRPRAARVRPRSARSIS